jgi:hypothetical protein
MIPPLATVTFEDINPLFFGSSDHCQSAMHVVEQKETSPRNSGWLNSITLHHESMYIYNPISETAKWPEKSPWTMVGGE